MKRSILQIAGFMSLLLIFSVFTSCDEDEERVPDLSANPEAREEIYEQILSDEQLLSEFMNDMGENEMAMENFSNNPGMTKRMYGGDRMHRMMRNNPQMRDSLMQGMMMGIERDSTMRPTPQMRQRMLQHVQIMMQRDSAFASEIRQMMDQPVR